jgi:hypothetical protein
MFGLLRLTVLLIKSPLTGSLRLPDWKGREGYEVLFSNDAEVAEEHGLGSDGM